MSDDLPLKPNEPSKSSENSALGQSSAESGLTAPVLPSAEPNVAPAPDLTKPVFTAPVQEEKPEEKKEDIVADFPSSPPVSEGQVPVESKEPAPIYAPPVSSVTGPTSPPPPEPPAPPAAGPVSEIIPPAAIKNGSLWGKLKIPLIIILLIAVGFAAFKFLPGIIKKPAGKPITLTYWGLWESEEILQPVIAAWEKEHSNTKINYVMQSPKEYRERLQSALARGEGPDLFRFHLTWVPMLKNELDVVPATVMSSSQYESTYYPVVSSFLRSGSNFLGMPLMMDTLALYYNEDIFKSASKSPPTTWEELRQLASTLTTKDEDGRLVISGAALGTTSNVDHWSDILGLMMLQNGASLTNPSLCTRKQEAGEETETCLGEDSLTFYTLFAKTDKVWNETMPPSVTAFAGGKVAMIFAPSWRAFNIKELNPDLNFKVAPVPQLSGSKITWASFWMEGVSKRSQNSQEAWEFLKFLSSQENLEKLYESESSLRLFGELYPKIEMAQALIKNPLIEPFLTQGPRSQSWYLCSNTYDNGINDRMIKYFEDAVNGVNQGKSAKEALQTTSQGVSQLLSQYGLSSSIVR